MARDCTSQLSEISVVWIAFKEQMNILPLKIDLGNQNGNDRSSRNKLITVLKTILSAC